MGKYFGTDGFRGEANVKLTADLAFRTGRYLGWYYSSRKEENSRCRIVIGEDTRRSSAMLRTALAAGITASGADAYVMHVTTTPSVAYITKTEKFDCGVMISASHNPYYDNGLKVINSDGAKLRDADIAGIESYLDADADTIPYAERESIGLIYEYTEGREKYIKELLGIAAKDFSKYANTAENADTDSCTEVFKGMKIALDCANGSASAIAGKVYRQLGAEISVMADSPDGFNINDGVGSTHMRRVRDFTVKNGCDIGFAYDGDADRCLAVDELGNEINGDQLIFAAALAFKEKGILKNNTAVVTVMSNFGLFKAFEKEGISYEKTAVGDRFVWECMAEHGYNIGGEQSGHIIFADNAQTGDGILTSIKILGLLKEAGLSASEMFGKCRMYPQVLKNVRTSDKEGILKDQDVLAAVKKAEAELGDGGRVLLRASGTEPLIRVMAEAASTGECEKIAGDIIAVMKNTGLLEEQ